MSIAVLVQVHEEVRRLAIAGSAVASGDFRLKKLVAPLEQAGAKAPVFARVAQAAQAVVDSSDRTASAALLDLASLVNAILYTQGETGISGEFTPLQTTNLGARDTQTSARQLKPLLDALASTGSGRLELVRDAVERGMFKDLRLIRPALNGLDDPYPEIADLIAQKVLPMYGTAILPELRARLDIKGRGGHLHRLRLLHKLDAEGTSDTVRRALDEGSKEIRVVAIECLDTSGDDLGYVLDQAKSKARDVRAAALRALAAVRTAAADVIGALKRAIDGADLELITDRLKEGAPPEVRDYVLAQAQRHLADTLALKDAKQQGPAILRLQQLVRSLQGRTDSGAEAFLLRCFDAVPTLARIRSTPSGQDFNELLAEVLATGTPLMRQRLVSSHKTLTGGMVLPAFEAARETLTPAEFFDQFSPTLAGLKRGKKGSDHERAVALAGVLTSRTYGVHYGAWYPEPEPHKASRELDPRWLDAAIDAGVTDLVCRLVRPGHAGARAFLSERLAGTKPHEEHQLLDAMVRMGHPGAADAILASLNKLAKTTYHGYSGYWYGPLIAGLPKGEAPRIEAALPTLPDKMVDQLIESVLELKNKPE